MKGKRKKNIVSKRVTRDWCLLYGHPMSMHDCMGCLYRGTIFHSLRAGKQEKFTVQCKFDEKTK